MPTIWTLGPDSKKTQFTYTGSVHEGVRIHFSGKPRISAAFFQVILDQFKGKTVRGGFSATEPTPGGLGEWVRDNSGALNGRKLTPRHASFIAAILVHEGFATSSLDGNAVVLHFGG